MFANYTSTEVITIIGVLFTGLGSVIAAVFAGVAATRTGKTGGVLEEIHKDTIETNTAVNHKDTGMPTMVQRVTDQDARSIQLAADLAAEREYRNEALIRIAKALNVELAPMPSPVVEPHIAVPVGFVAPS